MWGNGKIFVSHAHADNQRCEPLVAALDAWGLDYWFDTQQLDAGAQLSERLQRAIAECDVFLRVCTGSTRASYWMTLEFNAFRGLQLNEQRRRGSGTNRRVSINLILDNAYKAAAAGDGLAERADVEVDATAGPPAASFAQLRAALGLAPQRARRGIGRRAALGLGAAAVVTAAAAGTVVVVKNQPGPTVVSVPKPTKVPFAVPNPQTTDPRILWYFIAGTDTGPATALGPRALYLNADDGFYALNPSDGSVIWSNPAVSGNGDQTPVLVGSTIYTTDSLGKLSALSATDGSGLWSADTQNIFAPSIAVANGSVFALAYDGSIGAYSTTDGSARWRSVSLGKQGLSSLAPIASAGMVLIGTAGGAFYALSASDGTIKWSYPTGGEIGAAAAASGGAVYFGSKDGTLYAVDIASGKLKWRASASSEIDNTPIVSQGVLYIGVESYFFALSAATGKQLWMVPVGDVDASGTPTSFDFVSAAAAVSGDGIYVPSGAYLYAFSARAAAAYKAASGQPAYAWRFNAPGTSSNRWAPVAAAGVVYFATDNGAVYALKTS